MPGWLHTSLASTWPDFCREILLGAPLAHSQEEASRALSALAVHEPARYANLGKGVYDIAVAVERGLLIADNENCLGASDVIRKMLEGDRHADAQLVVGSALTRLGYSTQFEVPLEGKVLDVACDCFGTKVFFEVHVPERSDLVGEDFAAVERLRQKLLALKVEGFLEVEVAVRPTDMAANVVRELLLTAKPNNWVSATDESLRLRITPIGTAYPRLFDEEDGLQVRVGGDADIVGLSSLVLKWNPSAHERAKRVFDTEYDHFARTTANILVLNVSAVGDGLKTWPPALKRVLQPTHNRNVGAVLLYNSGVIGPPERVARRWQAVVNEHARVQVPRALIDGVLGFSDDGKTT